MTTYDIGAFLLRQKRIMEAMDMEGAWKLMHEEGGAEERPSNEVLEMSMHKARVELLLVEPKFRLESIEWLRARGLTRRYGLPLPPPGVLPV